MKINKVLLSLFCVNSVLARGNYSQPKSESEVLNTINQLKGGTSHFDGLSPDMQNKVWNMEIYQHNFCTVNLMVTAIAFVTKYGFIVVYMWFTFPYKDNKNPFALGLLLAKIFDLIVLTPSNVLDKYTNKEKSATANQEDTAFKFEDLKALAILPIIFTNIVADFSFNYNAPMNLSGWMYNITITLLLPAGVTNGVLYWFGFYDSYIYKQSNDTSTPDSKNCTSFVKNFIPLNNNETSTDQAVSIFWHVLFMVNFPLFLSYLIRYLRQIYIYNDIFRRVTLAIEDFARQNKATNLVVSQDGNRVSQVHVQNVIG